MSGHKLDTVCQQLPLLKLIQTKMSEQELTGFLRSRKELRETNRVATLFKNLCLISSFTLIFFLVLFTQEIRVVLTEFARKIGEPSCPKVEIHEGKIRHPTLICKIVNLM